MDEVLRRLPLALLVCLVAAPAAAASTVLVSARDGAVLRRLPDLSPQVAVADGRGGWLVAGGSVAGIERLRHDGSVDPGWRAPAGLVVALVRSGGTVYAATGGSVSAYRAATGGRLWALPVHRPHALAVAGGRVFAATEPRIVALDARTGRPLRWSSPPLAHGGYFLAVAADRTRVYVGGSFGSLDGQPRSQLAALDPRTGALLPWRPPAVGDAERLLVFHGLLLNAGHDGFGVTDLRTDREASWLSQLRGVASSFAGSGPILYLGGDSRNGFTSAGGMPRRNLAAVDLETGRVTRWGPDLARYVSVGTIAPSGETVLVAGDFRKSVG